MPFNQGYNRNSFNLARYNWLIIILLMLLSGFCFNCFESALNASAKFSDFKYDIPNIPLKIGSWTGQDIQVPQVIQKVSGSDCFINRLYINNSTNEWANVYIAHSARPSAMLGHNPKTCYVGSGWIHDNTSSSSFTTPAGKTIPCLIHRFHKPNPDTEEIVILNFYIFNGKIITSESEFARLKFRSPGFQKSKNICLAQIQISSTIEVSVRKLAELMTDIVLDHFPGSIDNLINDQL